MKSVNITNSTDLTHVSSHHVKWYEAAIPWAQAYGLTKNFMGAIVGYYAKLTLDNIRAIKQYPYSPLLSIVSQTLGSSAVSYIDKYVEGNWKSTAKRLNEYQTVDTSTPSEFDNLKQLIKYVVGHNNSYLSANDFCRDKDIELVKIPPCYIFENIFYSNESVAFTLCEVHLQPISSEGNSIYLNESDGMITQCEVSIDHGALMPVL